MLDAAAQYREALYRFVIGRVKDRAAAEDIVHDVLVRAHEKQSQLRDQARLAPWLYQMTRNAITDHHRAQKPHEEVPEDLAAPEEEREALQELARCLTPLIQQLPERYRTALEMSELQGLTQQETAEHLGISLSGAKSRVQRARAKLEDLVHQCCRIELNGRGSVVDYEPRHRCTSLCNGACSH
jgi:RNA polymerase sigma-70 factor, ECF subfamily